MDTFCNLDLMQPHQAFYYRLTTVLFFVWAPHKCIYGFFVPGKRYDHHLAMFLLVERTSCVLLYNKKAKSPQVESQNASCNFISWITCGVKQNRPDSLPLC